MHAVKAAFDVVCDVAGHAGRLVIIAVALFYRGPMKNKSERHHFEGPRRAATNWPHRRSFAERSLRWR